MVGGELGGHHGGGVGVEAQVHDRAVRVGAGYAEAPVVLGDQVAVAGEAVGGPVPLQRGHPGLLDELEQAGGGGASRLGEGVEAALAPGGAQEEAEVDARRARRAPHGRLHDGAQARDAPHAHGQELPGVWLRECFVLDAWRSRDAPLRGPASAPRRPSPLMSNP